MPRNMSQLDPVLVPLLVQVMEFVSQRFDDVQDLHLVELFAGAAAITKAGIASGLASEAFDKSYSESDEQDIVSKRGFARALGLVMRLAPHGTLWSAPVCSSWTWIGRSQTGRSSDTPYGDLESHIVVYMNKMVVNLTLLGLLAWVRGAHIFVENPVGTLIHKFSPFEEFLTSCCPHRSVAHLCSYGAPSQKSVLLWSSTPLVANLKLPKVPTTQRLTVRDENGVTGLSKALKSSQAYPVQFGVVVTKIVRECLEMRSSDDLLLPDAGDEGERIKAKRARQS